MNPRLKNAMLAGLGIVVLMALFPPWAQCELRWIQRPNSNAYEGTVFVRSAGYGFVLIPPKVGTDPGAQLDASFIDCTRLVIQWVVVVAVTLGVVIALSGKERVVGDNAQPTK